MRILPIYLQANILNVFSLVTIELHNNKLNDEYFSLNSKEGKTSFKNKRGFRFVFSVIYSASTASLIRPNFVDEHKKIARQVAYYSPFSSGKLYDVNKAIRKQLDSIKLTSRKTHNQYHVYCQDLSISFYSILVLTQILTQR